MAPAEAVTSSAGATAATTCIRCGSRNCLARPEPNDADRVLPAQQTIVQLSSPLIPGTPCLLSLTIKGPWRAATTPASSGSTKTSGSSAMMPLSPRPASKMCWTVKGMSGAGLEAPCAGACPSRLSDQSQWLGYICHNQYAYSP